MGLLVFLWLSSHRTSAPRDVSAAAVASEASQPIAAAPPPPPELSAMEAASRAQSPAPAPAAAAAPIRPGLSLSPPTPAAPPQVAAPVAGSNSPVLVVDLASSPPANPAATPGTAAKAADAPAGKPGTGGLNTDEQFAARVSGAQPDRARATVLHNRGSVIAQGAVIPAVLETALDSDLPGFARAVVSRDVRSFDGAAVLIPRGSRVIGEYRSAAALGQSRAFIIWTRVLRPDGVSVQIGSPVTDPLGRAGVAGSVDHHFLERFGGAILMSVVTAGANALAGEPNTEVVVGSSQDAANLASNASVFAPVNIPPTIKVPQGSPIRIFVARDLDFTPVADHEP
jgi:type IV secretion system protein VirB10